MCSVYSCFGSSISTSFQGPLLSVPRGREGVDPGNQVARIIVSAHGQEPVRLLTWISKERIRFMCSVLVQFGS